MHTHTQGQLFLCFEFLSLVGSGWWLSNGFFHSLMFLATPKISKFSTRTPSWKQLINPGWKWWSKRSIQMDLKCHFIIRGTRSQIMRRWKNGSWTCFWNNTASVSREPLMRKGLSLWELSCGLINFDFNLAALISTCIISCRFIWFKSFYWSYFTSYLLYALQVTKNS